MTKRILLHSLFVFAVSCLVPHVRAAEPPREIRIAVIGDSTVCEYPEASNIRGWGQFLAPVFQAHVRIINLAKSGRSTKTFIKEGLWSKTLAEKPHFVLIQFGHNDSHAKGRPESTDAATDYREFLNRYVDEARAAGATPVLVTPMHRRNFDREGKLTQELLPYAEAMKAVAKEKQVAVVDLHAASGSLFQGLGDAGSADLSCSPTDRTHFSEKGAKAMAGLVLKELPRVEPAMRALLAAAAPGAAGLERIPDRLVVLTFDDSVKSQFTIVRPALLKRGFAATFFITEGFDFTTNKVDYMTWAEIAQLHKDGFEIGNHTRSHLGLNDRNLNQITNQLGTIAERCREHGIPVPTTFAYPGNAITTNALPFLRACGIRFARRGGAPEYPYDRGRGVAYQPGLDHPLLIPTAGDARPDWTLADFVRAAEQARDGRIAVLQFHGVPDRAHPWVNTPPEKFEAYLDYLAANRYRVIALRDLARFVDPLNEPRDPMSIIEARKKEILLSKPASEVPPGKSKP